MSSFVITDKVWLRRRALHRPGSTLFRWCVEAVGPCVLLFTCQRSGTRSADGFIAQRDHGLQSYGNAILSEKADQLMTAPPWPRTTKPLNKALERCETHP